MPDDPVPSPVPEQPTVEDAASSPASEGPTLDGAAHRPGDSIGRYRLFQRVGTGGMGEVWLAEQTEPVRRQVALKVIRAGMDSAQVIARFEAERQALALMDHPAIATVFDGGTTPQGRPYFAMEYVKGETITKYCDRHRLSTNARLELFTQVCGGVQHAHQRGIIHRDLKPSNVLVTIQDDRPVPKIIDFGVAKATSRQLTERSLFTELGVLIGTPEYMSPEQAEMGGLDIDVRTDIYALGVLLYELLTGSLPFDSRALRQAGFAEIQRIIREKEPPRPSTRIGQLGPASMDAARNRQTEPRRLASAVRGDLDWITMRALEKDRTRRYETANALATDVRRHLGNEPVSAGPPSTTYRARKFVRRHRAPLAAALAIATAGAAGLWQANRARSAELSLIQGKRESVLTEALLDMVGKQYVRDGKKAWSRNRMSQVITESLIELKQKGQLDPPSLARLNKEAADLDSGQLRSEPMAEADARRSLGEVYALMERDADAAGQFRKCLNLCGASGRTETLIANPGVSQLDATDLRVCVVCQIALGTAVAKQGRFDEAEQLLLGAYKVPGARRMASVALVTLYSSWGRADKTAEWREKAESHRYIEH